MIQDQFVARTQKKYGNLFCGGENIHKPTCAMRLRAACWSTYSNIIFG